MAVLEVRCPQCRKKVKRDNPHFPFCSERCKLIDLGHWAAGDYAIPGDELPENDDIE